MNPDIFAIIALFIVMAAIALLGVHQLRKMPTEIALERANSVTFHRVLTERDRLRFIDLQALDAALATLPGYHTATSGRHLITTMEVATALSRLGYSITS